MANVLVLGGGLMGRAMAYDLCRQEQVDEVRVVDIDQQRLDEAKAIVDSEKAVFETMSVTDDAALKSALTGVSLTMGAVSYQFNRRFTEACIEAGSHFIDLGGNDAIVDEQFALHERARQAGVTVFPDCGLAPGLAGLLGYYLYEGFDRCEEIHLRVGGLPQNPRPPLDYMLVFSMHGLINEYKEDCRVLQDGKLVEVPGMSGLETIRFPEPFGDMEAFFTSGGVSTLVKTLAGKVAALDYKTIRYPGHQAKIKLLMDLGFFGEDKRFRGMSAREITEELLLDTLVLDDLDLTMLRVWGTGVKDGERKTHTVEFIDRHDEKTGLSAMMRTTAFPATIIGGMLLRGEIAERGVLRQELAVPVPTMITELQSRGVAIREY